MTARIGPGMVVAWRADAPRGRNRQDYRYRVLAIRVVQQDEAHLLRGDRIVIMREMPFIDAPIPPSDVYRVHEHDVERVP
jgi:hypothetical protein